MRELPPYYFREIEKFGDMGPDIIERAISEYLLTISAADYVKSRRKRLCEFDFMSIDNAVERKSHDLTEKILSCKKGLAEKAFELGAEVVVDIRSSITNDVVYMSGTALIPKRDS